MFEVYNIKTEFKEEIDIGEEVLDHHLKRNEVLVQPKLESCSDVPSYFIKQEINVDEGSSFIKDEVDWYKFNRTDLETNIDIKAEEFNDPPPHITVITSKKIPNPVAILKMKQMKENSKANEIGNPRRKYKMGPLPLECDYCGKVIRHKEKLLNHMRSTHLKYPSKTEIESLPSNLEVLLESEAHSNASNLFECDNFGNSYHSCCNSIKKRKRKSIDCKDCQRIFPSKRSLAKQERIHTKPLEKIAVKLRKFECDICGKSFKLKHHIGQHIRTHSSSKKHSKVLENIRKFECKTCGSKFLTNSKLKVHQVSHQKIKNVACIKCNKMFKTQQDMKRHLKTHDNIQPFVCLICGKGLKSKQCLEYHLNAHSRKKNLEKVFECHVCEKQFEKRQNLIRHFGTHSNSKPFTCDYCGKHYKSKDEMVKHFVVHFNLRKFICKICGFAFCRNFHLLAHVRKLHSFELGINLLYPI